MGRTKIDYGIDLGTTNSAIARMEKGTPVIKKSEGYLKDTTPSCIHFNKKKATIVGDRAYNILGKEAILAFKKNDPALVNTYIEFKRNMGSDEKFKCKNMGRAFSPEELSAEVLKALKGNVRDEEINSIVVTVPAKFKGVQKDATQKAAELAGFQHCLLLQEPIAASTAYGINANSIEDGEWLVFDFGGGTFDVALMKANEGIMKVMDTEGDNHLGGKNLDSAIVDKILMPYLEDNYTINKILADDQWKGLLQNALKHPAEEIKINLTSKDKNQYEYLSGSPIGKDDEGNGMEIDLTITKDQYEEALKPIFQRAVDISKKLLNNNNLKGSDLTTVLMIGGPTFSHTLREMIRKQITSKINISIDPMTAVANGAALFASRENIPEGVRVKDHTKIQLKVSYQADAVETEQKVGIKVLRDKTDGEVPEKLFVALNRMDKGWTSGKVELKGDAEILDVHLEAGKSNGFEILITDEKGTTHPCEPESISMIQGFKVAEAVLPFDLCVDAFEIAVGRQQLTTLKGLQKNHPLPAKGSGTYRTSEDVRPGKKQDIINIPIYEGKAGTKAIYNDFRGIVKITGDELNGLLPKGSDIELKIEIDQSEAIKVTATFPYLEDQMVEDVLEKSKRSAVTKNFLKKELKKAQSNLEKLEDEYTDLDAIKVEEIRTGLNELIDSLEKGGSSADTREEILNNMREYCNEIEVLESTGEWPKVMQDLTKAIEGLEMSIEEYGGEKATQLLKQINAQVKTVIDAQDVKMAKRLTQQIDSISFAVVDQGAGVAMEISLIKGFDDNFDMHDWKDEGQARNLINQAKGIINANNATKEILRPIVGQLYQLLPMAPGPDGGPGKGGIIY